MAQKLAKILTRLIIRELHHFLRKMASKVANGALTRITFYCSMGYNSGVKASKFFAIFSTVVSSGVNFLIFVFGKAEYKNTVYDCIFCAKNALLADFLIYLFPPDEKDGPLKVSSTCAAGALLIALAEPSAFPVEPEGAHRVRLDLPWVRNATSAIHSKWVAYSKSSTARINLALQAEFDLDFAGYYRKGEELGIRKRDIIDAFIFSRGLSPGTYDALHKRVYRREQKNQDDLRRKLLRKAYYINESIDYSGLI